MARHGWTCDRGGLVGRHLARPGAGLRPDHRAGRRFGAAGAGRGRLGDLRERIRARRCPGDLDPRQHRIAIYRRDVADALPAGIPAKRPWLPRTRSAARSVSHRSCQPPCGDGPRGRPGRVRRGHAGLLRSAASLQWASRCSRWLSCGTCGPAAESRSPRIREPTRTSMDGALADPAEAPFRIADRTRNSPARSERRRTASLCRVREHAEREGFEPQQGGSDHA